MKQRKGELFQIGGAYENEHFYHLKFMMSKCINSTFLSNSSWQPVCDTPQNIQNSIKQDTRISIIVTNMQLNPEKTKDYALSFLNAVVFAFQPEKMYTTANVMLNKQIMETDESIIPVEDKHTDIYTQYSNNDFKQSFSVGNFSNYCEIYFHRSFYTTTMTRQFLKLDEVISYIGGFSQVFLLFSAIIVNYYNDYVYTFELANRLYDFDIRRKKNNKKTLNQKQDNRSISDDATNRKISQHNFTQQLMTTEADESNKINKKVMPNEKLNHMISLADDGRVLCREDLGLIPLDQIQKMLERQGDASIIVPNSVIQSPKQAPSLQNIFSNQTQLHSCNNPSIKKISTNQESTIIKETNNEQKLENTNGNKINNKNNEIKNEIMNKIKQKKSEADKINENKNESEVIDNKQQNNNENKEQLKIQNPSKVNQVKEDCEKKIKYVNASPGQDNKCSNETYNQDKTENEILDLDQICVFKDDYVQESPRNVKFRQNVECNQLDNTALERNTRLPSLQSTLKSPVRLQSDKNVFRAQQTLESKYSAQNSIINQVTTKSRVDSQFKNDKMGRLDTKEFLEKELKFILMRERRLWVNIKFFLNKLSCGKLFNTEEVQLLNKAEDLVRSDLDIFNVLDRLKEFNKLRNLLLTPQQQTLFNFFPKPLISIQQKSDIIDRKTLITEEKDPKLNKKHSTVNITKSKKNLDLNFKNISMVSKAVLRLKGSTKKDQLSDYQKLFNCYEELLSENSSKQLFPKIYLIINQLFKIRSESKFNQKLIDLLGDEMKNIFKLAKMYLIYHFLNPFYYFLNNIEKNQYLI